MAKPTNKTDLWNSILSARSGAYLSLLIQNVGIATVMRFASLFDALCIVRRDSSRIFFSSSFRSWAAKV
jgi:hypothetical protein